MAIPLLVGRNAGERAVRFAAVTGELVSVVALFLAVELLVAAVLVGADTAEARLAGAAAHEIPWRGSPDTDVLFVVAGRDARARVRVVAIADLVPLHAGEVTVVVAAVAVHLVAVL